MLRKRALGVVLAYRADAADRQRGLELLAEVRDLCLNERFFMPELPSIDLHAAAVQARLGDRDGAIPVMRKAVDDMFTGGQLAYGVAATGILAETLLDRATARDITEAQTAIDRLTNAAAEKGLVVCDITSLRLRALLARACGDDAAYHHFVDRYRAMANSLGFEGHIDLADAM